MKKDYRNEYSIHNACCGDLREDDIDRDVVLAGWI